MGEVIHAAFGNEREWADTRAKLLESLLSVGTLFGDNEELLRAKAACVCDLIREITEEVPKVILTMKLPENLTSEQLESVTIAIQEAALKGIEHEMMHAIKALVSSVYDLCTSKLQHEPS